MGQVEAKHAKIAHVTLFPKYILLPKKRVILNFQNIYNSNLINKQINNKCFVINMNSHDPKSVDYYPTNSSVCKQNSKHKCAYTNSNIK